MNHTMMFITMISFHKKNQASLIMLVEKVFFFYYRKNHFDVSNYENGRNLDMQ